MTRSRTAPAEGRPERAATAPWLAVAGGLSLLALFLVENAWFGTHARAWPWDAFVGGGLDLARGIVRALWAAAALSALLLAFCPAERVRAAVLAVLLAALVAACADGPGPLAPTVRTLQDLLPLIALGAGLVLATRAPTRGVGRVLASLGALAFAWRFGAMWHATPDKEGAFVVVRWWADVRAAVADPAGALADPTAFWWTLVPQTLVLLACALGLLAGLGATGRVVLRVALAVLVVALVLPYGASPGIGLEQAFALKAFPEQVAAIAFGQGFLLWLLGLLVLVDASRAARRAA